jgi:hypothetical protein
MLSLLEALVIDRDVVGAGVQVLKGIHTVGIGDAGLYHAGGFVAKNYLRERNNCSGVVGDPTTYSPTIGLGGEKHGKDGKEQGEKKEFRYGFHCGLEGGTGISRRN